MKPIVVRANAKINLGLKVLGKREDGYHDILSVLQTLDLHDRLTLSPAPEGKTEIVCDDPGVPGGRGNLVHQAVEALRNCTGVAQGVRVAIEKRIPTGAGLGGGSSDAAATLVALDRLWGLGLREQQLHVLASRLGSDVPFFLRRGTAVATGRGQSLQYVPWGEDVRYVLVYPGFQVSSGWAYQNLKIALTADSRYIKFVRFSANDERKASLAGLLDCLENDFLPLLEETYPEAKRVLEALRACDAGACSVSGSGSTLFGVFREDGRARRAASSLRAGGHRVCVCRPVVD